MFLVDDTSTSVKAIRRWAMLQPLCIASAINIDSLLNVQYRKKAKMSYLCFEMFELELFAMVTGDNEPDGAPSQPAD